MAGVGELEAIVELLDRALHTDQADEPVADRGRAVGLMAEIRNPTAALDADVVGAYDSSKEWAGDGHKSPSVGVRHCSRGDSQGTARTRAARARKLREAPVVRDALGAGEIRRIVFGADGHVLDYGRARDRRCRMPGCLLPASKCQIDHVHERRHGGETSEANGECLCRFHNLWKTNHLTKYRRLRGWN